MQLKIDKLGKKRKTKLLIGGHYPHLRREDSLFTRRSLHIVHLWMPCKWTKLAFQIKNETGHFNEENGVQSVWIGGKKKFVGTQAGTEWIKWNTMLQKSNLTFPSPFPVPFFSFSPLSPPPSPPSLTLTIEFLFYMTHSDPSFFSYISFSLDPKKNAVFSPIPILVLHHYICYKNPKFNHPKAYLPLVLFSFYLFYT